MSVSIFKQLKKTFTRYISEDLYIKLKYNRCESVARKVLYSLSGKKYSGGQKNDGTVFFYL
jgi:hypothetical protein